MSREQDTQYTDPKKWGPYFWFTFRCIANNYPDNPTNNDITYTKTFYECFTYLLPCPVCKESYIEHLKTYPLTMYLTSKTSLVQWTNLIYDAVTNKIINDKKALEKQIITRTTTKSCSSCGKSNVQPSDNLFPQASPNNSGISKGLVGGLRKTLAKVDMPLKYHLLSFYNWIKYVHKIPPEGEAINILKGYNILKNDSPQDYYPGVFDINGTIYNLSEDNKKIILDMNSSYLIYRKFKELSI